LLTTSFFFSKSLCFLQNSHIFWLKHHFRIFSSIFGLPWFFSSISYQAWDFPFRASAVSACALALLLALLPTDAAEAARSGGRMGGSSRAARAPRPQPRAQPKASSTTRWGGVVKHGDSYLIFLGIWDITTKYTLKLGVFES